jgi:hypothetical protein
MGHLDIGVNIYSPNFEADIKQLLQSLSFNLPVSFQENAHIVFVTPDAPEWYVNSMELPEWGKPICESFFRVTHTISNASHDHRSIILDLLKVGDLRPKDWFAPDTKAFFYHQGNQSICFVLLFENGKDPETMLRRITGYLYFFAIYWYASHRGLLLHSAAVANNRNGFLFLGEGGAGKSTVSSLSASIGASVLSDDLAFVVRRGNGRYELAAAPGLGSRYTTNPLLRPQLKGIFRLVKDTHDDILPISQIATAHFIFRSFEWSYWIDHLSPKVLSLAYQTACDIARSIPGYELHFRKSPNFWTLIDEKFSD